MKLCGRDREEESGHVGWREIDSFCGLGNRWAFASDVSDG